MRLPNRRGTALSNFIGSRRGHTVSYLTAVLLITILLAFRDSLIKGIPLGPQRAYSIGWQHDQSVGEARLQQTSFNLTDSENQDVDLSTLSDSSSPPLTEIYIQSCTFPPGLWDICAPPSSAAEDAVRGPWIMLNRDLNKHVGLWYTYIFFRRRIKGSPLPAITDIKLLTPTEAESDDMNDELREGGWRKAEGESMTGAIWREPPLNLWYETNPAGEAITDLQVVYGSSGFRSEKWEEVGTVSAVKGKDPVKLQALRGSPVNISTPQLRFDQHGNFTILQIADLHFSVGDGKCRDIANISACPSSPEASDLATIQWLNNLLDEHQPDLIVLSGDQLNGQETSWDAASVLYKVNMLFAGREIPWTAVFGNHDSEATDLDRRTQMSLMQQLPYFVGSASPEEVDGVSNFYLPIKGRDASSDPLFSLYFIDSHASYKPTLFSEYQYDWIKDSQIDWFKSVSNQVRPILRPYEGPIDLSSEDVAFGIPDILNEGLGALNGAQEGSEDNIKPKQRRKMSPKRQMIGQEMRKPNAIAFFHIPLPEAYDEPDVSAIGEPMSIGTKDLEEYSAPKKNSGFFTKALLAQSEVGTMDGLDEFDSASPLPEVKVIAHGHSHLRDSCDRIKGIWMCFSGGSSYSGYGLRGFDRRTRVFSLSDWGETISTYKVLDGSGQGDRDDGTWASLSSSAVAAQKTGEIGKIEVSKEISAQQGDEDGEEFVSDEVNDEGLPTSGNAEEQAPTDESEVTDVETQPMTEETLEEIVEEIAAEQQKEEAAGLATEDEDWKRHRRRQFTSRYKRLDEVVLVGKGAM